MTLQRQEQRQQQSPQQQAPQYLQNWQQQTTLLICWRHVAATLSSHNGGTPGSWPTRPFLTGSPKSFGGVLHGSLMCGTYRAYVDRAASVQANCPFACCPSPSEPQTISHLFLTCPVSFFFFFWVTGELSILCQMAKGTQKAIAHWQSPRCICLTTRMVACT